MRFSTTKAAVAVAATLPLALAQTFTDCNPTEKSCPSDPGLNKADYQVDFTDGAAVNASWTPAAYTTIDYTGEGAVFSIATDKQAPTIQTNFYFFFGRVDVVMKASPGTGIVSSVVLESDDLDEIDWEFIGGSAGQVQSDFFGKANTTSYDRAQYHDIADTQDTWHTYSVDWTEERIEWLIDNSVVRSLPYSADLTVGGKNYPQTPMRLKLGSWCGGCASAEGTVTWAGGKTTFDNAPYNMYVKSVSITNANPGCSYSYGDQTGSYQSIKVSNTDCDVDASPSSSATASGSSGSKGSAATTSAASVQDLSGNIGVVASSTITGSAYSTNTAAISSINSAISSGFFTTTAGSNGTAATRTPTPTPQSTTGAAVANHVNMAAGGLMGLALGVFML